MTKVRVYDLARELGVSNKELVDLLRQLGEEVKSHSSTIDEKTAEAVRELVRERQGKTTVAARTVHLPPHPLPVTEVAQRLGTDIGSITRTLMSWGIVVAPHQPLELETVIRLVKEMGYDFVVERETAPPQPTDGQTTAISPPPTVTEPTTPPVEEHPKEPPPSEDAGETVETKEVKPTVDKRLVPRPPVVTVMGHVDHGKTTLLDTIRKTNIAAQEYGQITQHIGAYEVEWQGRRIVFIDTPGHEAFTALRARGAMVTDIVVLVVAADDGVMPQTVEAIHHAQAAGVPIIVAINKIDRPDANPDRVKAQLAEHGLIPEEWGGDTVCVNISALRGDGIPELLEMILLLADLLDLKADPEAPAWGYILEAKMDPRRGPTSTVIVKEGTLHKGDWVVAGATYGRIRLMTNWKGEELKEAGPSTPVSILGLEELPQAGDRLEVVEDGRIAKEIAQQRLEEQRRRILQPARRVTLEDFFAQVQSGAVKELNLIVKADVQGSLDAILYALSRIEHPEVKVRVIHKGVGDVSENDVMLAAASNAVVLGFNVRIDPSGRRALQHEPVDVRLYRIIYELLDDVKRAIVGLLEPIRREEVLGVAEVRATFRTRIGTVAGCFVQKGRIVRGAQCRIIRGGQVIATGRIVSLRHFTEDREEILEGMECGIGVDNFSAFENGDLIEAFQIVEVQRSVDEIKERPAELVAAQR
ncbi:Translation initiation factor IF-2 [bacterium HR17]|uniref:Translation initiation factor IF-2 n=1 Tax=Candidatus Fervidibacter japonicus TaxID=2035412 RepID=A0A2H5XCZ1_9BACT|nr:Translation initiation factor IF-2 [bacterium HR17]